MSLYNNVADNLSANGLLGALRSGIASTIGGAGAQAAQAMGGGKLATHATKWATNAAIKAAEGLVNKHVPPQLARAIDAAGGMVGDVMSGDYEGAAIRLLDSGVLTKYLPGLGGIASQANYWGTPTPLLGGISPTEAKQIHDEVRSTSLAKRNLFLLEVSSPLQGDVSSRFNLFATDVEYSPFIVSGEKRRVGSASVDSVNSGDPVEMRITTMDDKSGFIKRWFVTHAGTAAPRDGTVSPPATYAIRVRVVHAYITNASNRGGYEDVGWFRPASMEVSLSRREDSLEELQLSFTQLDTFMRA